MKPPRFLKASLLSFFLPFTIMGLAFALHGVFPFGSRQILTKDLLIQYFPFFSGFWHKIREGGMAPWSWNGGAGYDFTALFAYSLASPLNFLAAMFPFAWLGEAQTLILLIKIGCAGLFAGMFLRYAANRWLDKKDGIELPLFASLYALCAFTLGYYYSINSFDSFALLPLVAMGFLALINEGKYKLYIISLALAVFSNFYYSFFVCIFIVISFLSYCIIKKLNIKNFFRKLVLIAGSSAMAIGMTAVILLPVLAALQNVYSGGSSPSEPALYHSFFDIFGNFIAFTPPTAVYGLPNLYSGMISIPLAGLYFFSKKVSRREKIVVTVILAFLLLSCNFNILDYIMHGFRFPNGLPSRFSFLISFIIVVTAYRGFLLLEGAGRRSMLVMCISCLIFLLSAILGSQEKNALIGSAVLCIVYLVLLYFMQKGTARLPLQAGRFLKVAFLIVIIVELSVSAWIGVKTAGTSEREENIVYYNQTQSLLEMRDLDANGGSPALQQADFYRTEIPSQNYNLPFIYNYNGISFFSSTVNADLTGFMQGLGLGGGTAGNDFKYYETSPLVNAFLNLRYIILHKAFIKESILEYWNIIGETDDLFLLKNKYYLPLGFMVKEEAAAYSKGENHFVSQNDLFRLATRLKGDLFTRADMTAISMYEYEGQLLTSYRIPFDSMLYSVSLMIKGKENIDIYVNGDFYHQISNHPPILPLFSPIGNFLQGDIVSFVTGKDTIIALSHFDSELFEQGYKLLARSPLVLTKFTDTEVCGTVTALENGLLYTSIPADRNWSVYVDGEKSEIIKIGSAMAAVRLSKGEHQIEFRYFNKSLVTGIVVSLISLVIFITMLLLKKGIGDRGK